MWWHGKFVLIPISFQNETNDAIIKNMVRPKIIGPPLVTMVQEAVRKSEDMAKLRENQVVLPPTVILTNTHT